MTTFVTAAAVAILMASALPPINLGDDRMELACKGVEITRHDDPASQERKAWSGALRLDRAASHWCWASQGCKESGRLKAVSKTALVLSRSDPGLADLSYDITLNLSDGALHSHFRTKNFEETITATCVQTDQVIRLLKGAPDIEN